MMQGIDIETTSLSPEEGRIRLVQIRDEEGGRIWDLDYEDPREAIQALPEPVAHNAEFERRWIAHHLGLGLELDDTMIMSQVLYTGTKASKSSNFGHSLAAVVKRELRKTMDKTEQTSDWNGDLTQEELLYAAYDAHVLPELAETLMRKIDKAGLRKVYELERRVARAVGAMEAHGVAIHTDRLDEMIEEAGERAKRLKDELAQEWGINPGSSKQLREYFKLDERDDWPKTPAGAASTNQEAMKALAEG
jgi:DNA polymerase-1